MRCVYLLGSCQVARGELSQVPRPEGSVCVRVTHVGICGSDLAFYRGRAVGNAPLEYPLVLGHEGVGIVQEGEMAGKLVSIEPTISCGKCPLCVRGSPNLCIEQRFLGLPPEPGLLREYLYHPVRLLEPVPSGVEAPVATLLEPLAVAISVFDLLRLRPASSVAILGCGGIGLLCLLVARAAGAVRILCTDPVKHRRETALELGADIAVPPAEAEGEYEYVVEASGDEGAHRDMLRLAAPGAKIAVVGTPSSDEIRLIGHAPRRKGLTLYMVRRSRLSLRRAAEMALRLPLAELVSHIFRFNECEAAMQTASTYADDCLRVVIAI